MRRIVPALALLGLAAGCDPTGNTDVDSSSATVRVANLVADAPTISVSASGVNVATGVAFGDVSVPTLANTEDPEFVTVRATDAFVLGTDTVVMVAGRKYTFYALGTVSAFVNRFALDDTLFGAAGAFKFRFVHGAKAQEGVGLDLYLSTTAAALADITPQIPSLAYGAASAYVTADTSLRRLRVTQVGSTTTLLDTTFAAHSDSVNITIVVSDKSGGGGPMRLAIVLDKEP